MPQVAVLAAERRSRHRRSALRPSRRWLSRVAAVAVVTLLATVPAVLPAGLAGAAAVDVQSERLWGASRYETAVDIAEAYVDDQGGNRSQVDTIILTSGSDHHFGYALAAPALARRHSAPLLLTETHRLTPSTQRFIRRYGIQTVYILGDTSVVSSAAERSVDSLPGVSTVRIADTDHYTTAVAVAQQSGPSRGEPGAYRSEGRTVLIATGDTFADALAAGPLAYRGEHPILLTPSDNLHPAVGQFLRTSRAAHAVILGGTRAVSAGVERELRGMGLSTERLWGTDRFGTATAIAAVLLGTDSPQPCFDGGELGLANAWRPPDAITSGPLLGHRCAPLLLTDQQALNATTRRFLNSSEHLTGDIDGALRIATLGGTAAVSTAAKADASAAATLPPITARIRAYQGRCHFTVEFGDPVRIADATNLDNYTLEGQRLSGVADRADARLDGATTGVTITLTGGSAPSDNAPPVGCASPLVARDDIEVIAGVIKSAGDKRTVEATRARVIADRSPPSLEILAFAGTESIFIESTEPIREADAEDAPNPELTIRREGVGIEVVPLTGLGDGVVRHEVQVPAAFGQLQVGDVISIARSQVQDLAGNTNVAKTARARQDNTAPRISRVTVSAPQSVANAVASIDGRRAGGRERDALTVTAKSGTLAAGAAGNDWTLSVLVRDDWAKERRSEITVSAEFRRIDLSAPADRTLADIEIDLNGTAAFSRLFEADVPLSALAASTTLDGSVALQRFDDGVSYVDLAVYWSEPVWSCGAEFGIDLTKLEIDIEGDRRYDFYLNGGRAEVFLVTFAPAPTASGVGEPDTAVCDTSAGVPEGTIVARLEAGDIDSLPSLQSALFDNGGAATDLRGNESVRRRFDEFTRP